MARYQIVQREYIPEHNLEVLNNTLNKRSELHNQAVKATSELKTAIANLNLNESEEPFRQQLVVDIENTLNANKSLGDYAGAYDDMIKISGDIASNPALISKLKAQQDYQNFITQIDARQDLPQHYKDYYKEQNKYYEGEYDEQGNWVKSTKWEPTKTAAVNVDKNKIFDEALKRITPDKGTFQINTWIDKNGNIVDKYQPDAKLVRYNTATYTYEEVKAEEIRKAIDDVIAANPLYADSLRQDYEIAKYDLIKGNKDALFNVDNGTGGPITFDQFVNRMFDDSVKSKAYKYTEWKKDDFNKYLHKELNAINGAASPTSPNSPYTNIGETAIYKDQSNIINFANVKKGNDEIKHDLSTLKYIPDNIINQTTLTNLDGFKKNLTNLLAQGALTKQQYDEALSTFNNKRFQYREELHNSKKYNDAKKGTREYDANEFYADFLYGELKPESERTPFYNRLCNEWATIEHALFGDDGEKLYIQFGNSAVLEDFKHRIKDANLEGYVDYSDDGAYINRSNNNLVPTIAGLYLQSMQEGYSGKPLRKLWNRITGQNSNTGDIIYRINDDGSYKHLHDNSLKLDNDIENIFTTLRPWGSFGGFNNNLADIISSVTPTTLKQSILLRGALPEQIAASNRFGQIMATIPGLSQLKGLTQHGLIYDSRDVLGASVKFMGRVNSYDDKQQIIESPIPNLSYNAGTPEGIIADAKIRQGDYEDLTERNGLEKQVFDSKKALFNQLKASGLYNMQVKMQDENGIMQTIMNADELKKIQDALVKADPSNDQNIATIELDRSTGRYIAKAKFVSKNGENDYNTYVLYLDDKENNYLRDLNNDPIMIGYGKIDNARISGQDVFLGTFNDTDIFAQPVEGGTGFRITDDTLSENYNIIGNNNITSLQQVAYFNQIFNTYGGTTDLTNQVLQYLPHMANILGISLEDKQSCMKILESLNDNFGIIISEDIINQIWEQ